jgi:hypothetical protein
MSALADGAKRSALADRTTITDGMRLSIFLKYGLKAQAGPAKSYTLLVGPPVPRLFDLSLIGEAVQAACRDNGLRRINYEVLGNSLNVLRGHVHARYEWEPKERIGGPVWRYAKEERNDPAVALQQPDSRRASRSDNRRVEQAPRSCLLATRSTRTRWRLGTSSGPVFGIVPRAN